ncbi:hypothetical protein QYZ38_25640 [Vibrio parahaemolyticus]|nr:hypothetical protein [Vibrio parahaemolyticus]
MWWQSHQTALIAKYWKQIESGYIKGDHLYVFDPAALDGLPEYLSANMTVIEPSTYLPTSQLSVEVVSSETGQPLSSSITTKKGAIKFVCTPEKLTTKSCRYWGNLE